MDDNVTLWHCWNASILLFWVYFKAAVWPGYKPMTNRSCWDFNTFNNLFALFTRVISTALTQTKLKIGREICRPLQMTVNITVVMCRCSAFTVLYRCVSGRSWLLPWRRVHPRGTWWWWTMLVGLSVPTWNSAGPIWQVCAVESQSGTWHSSEASASICEGLCMMFHVMYLTWSLPCWTASKTTLGGTSLLLISTVKVLVHVQPCFAAAPCRLRSRFDAAILLSSSHRAMLVQFWPTIWNLSQIVTGQPRYCRLRFGVMTGWYWSKVSSLRLEPEYSKMLEMSSALCATQLEDKHEDPIFIFIFRYFYILTDLKWWY